MGNFVNAVGNRFSDPAILVLSALAFAIFGVAIAALSNALWFRRWPQHSAFEDKLADTAHASLLGLSAFILALMITNGFSSLARTEENVRAEGVDIYRLGRELDGLGAAGRDAKAALAAYTQNVAGDEWRRLASAPNTLSPLAQQNLDDLWTKIRAAQRSLDPADPSRFDLARYTSLIETLRESRLAAASTNVPGVFWMILVIFVSATSFIAGRESPKRFGVQVNLLHMAGIGLAVGFVIILDNPFRGQTSINPAIIQNALTR